MTALADQLQQTLEVLYRVDAPASVEAFRMGPAHVDLYLGRGTSERRREALVVAGSSDGCTDVGLYLSDGVLGAAKRFIEERMLDAIDGFCAALEGVSHFLYFTFCGATQERPVSQVELELQAEVDKYLTLRVLLGASDLVERLFSTFTLDANLSDEETERYRVANRQARRYARWLETRFRQGRGADAMADARKLYRMPLAAKLGRIAAAA